MTATVLHLRDLESVLSDLADADPDWPEVAARLHTLGLSGADLPLRWDDYLVAHHNLDRAGVVYGDLCRSDVLAAERMACDTEADALHFLVFGRQ